MKNTKLIAVLFAAVTFLSCNKELSVVPESAITSEDSSEVTIHSNSRISGQIPVCDNVGSNIGGFLVALPYDYHSSTKKYPLLLSIHGIGQLGNGSSELYKVTNNGVPALLQKGGFPRVVNSGGNSFSFIIISPQFKKNPSPDDVLDMIESAKKRYRIDDERIYLTGLSMGGGTVMRFASTYPEQVAAVIPMAGAFRCDDANAEKVAKADLPVWAFHNEKDPVVNEENTITFVNMINSHKPSVKAKKTIFKGANEHNCWSKAIDPKYKEDKLNMYEWMLQYKIGSGKSAYHTKDKSKVRINFTPVVIHFRVKGKIIDHSKGNGKDHGKGNGKKK